MLHKPHSLAECFNMAFSGTLVTSGKGEGIVVATGTQTELGKINQMLAKVQPIATPLLRKISIFSKYLSCFILIIACLLFGIGIILHHIPPQEMFLVAVGIIVAAIPEGLPIILTVTLAIGVRRMAMRYAVIRKLPAVETLDSVSIICSDKTGTLTRNEMAVQKISLVDATFEVSGTGYQLKGNFYSQNKKIIPGRDIGLITLCTAAVSCNESEISFEKNEPYLQGDAMEGALLAMSAKAGIYRHQLVEVSNSKNRYLTSCPSGKAIYSYPMTNLEYTCAYFFSNHRRRRYQYHSPHHHPLPHQHQYL